MFLMGLGKERGPAIDGILFDFFLGEGNKILVLFEGGAIAIKIDLFDFLGVFITIFTMFSTSFDMSITHTIEIAIFFFFLHETLDFPEELLFLLLKFSSVFL